MNINEQQLLAGILTQLMRIADSLERITSRIEEQPQEEYNSSDPAQAFWDGYKNK